MRRAFCTLFVLVALCAFGCSSVRVTAEYDKSYDFSKVRTFTLVEPESEPPPPGWLSATENIRNQVVTQLQQLGFGDAEGDDPDLLLKVHLVHGKFKTEHQEGADFYGRVDWLEPNGVKRYRHRFAEKTLVLDLINPDTKRLVWRGWATRVVNNPEDTGETFDGVIEKMLEKLPAGKISA